MSKKEYVKLLCIAYALAVLGLGFLAVTIVLDEKGYRTSICVPMGIAAAVFILAFFVVLLPNYFRIMDYNYTRAVNKKKKGKHILLNGVTREKLIQACRDRGFKETDGCFYKHNSSLIDDVYYFVRIAEVEDGVENTVRKELKRLDAFYGGSQHAGLVLFLFGEGKRKEDLDWLKDFSANRVVWEKDQNLMPRYRLRCPSNIAVILVDKQTKTGYIGTKPSYGAMLYNQSVKIAKELLR